MTKEKMDEPIPPWLQEQYIDVVVEQYRGYLRVDFEIAQGYNIPLGVEAMAIENARSFLRWLIAEARRIESIPNYKEGNEWWL